MSTVDTTVYCARHPNVETVLRCGRCETPICPRCLVPTPVGARCPECARVKRFNFMVKPREFARAAGMGLAVAAVGALIYSFVGRLVPFFSLIMLAAIGYFVGEAVSVGANRKRAPELGPLAIVCLLIGYTLGPVLQAVLFLRLELIPFLLASIPFDLVGLLRTPPLLIGLGVGALLAWMRVR